MIPVITSGRFPWTVSVEQLAAIMPKADALNWTPCLDVAMREFEITTRMRAAAFLAQLAHESVELTRTIENLLYSDPVRIARIFRADFDLDRDRVVDPEEIEFAKGFIRQPEKLANFAYANQNGNGDAASGDGWRYRGRGPIQLTGRSNYHTAGLALSLPLEGKPAMVEEPRIGARVAGWYWDTRKLNPKADAGDFLGITKAINGGINGLEDRERYFDRAKRILGA